MDTRGLSGHLGCTGFTARRHPAHGQPGLMSSCPWLQPHACHDYSVQRQGHPPLLVLQLLGYVSHPSPDLGQQIYNLPALFFSMKMGMEP